MIFNLLQENSIANHFISELRDVEVQKDRARFRKNLERLGEILAYEISKNLEYKSVAITTPLAVTSANHLILQPVLVSVMRAGLPMFQGFLNLFDQASCAFIGAYRGSHNEDFSFDITLDYVTTPDLTDKTIILIDPMLATGKSLLSSYTTLLNFGKPRQIHIACAIATEEGINFVNDNIPNVSFWVGAIDEKLNNKFYIVPGLGDAGDLAYGPKL